MNPFGDTEREKYLYEKGIADGQSHSQPSPQTQKVMEILNVELAIMREQIKTIHHQLVDNKDAQKENQTQHQTILDKLDKFIDAVDSKLESNRKEGEEKFADKNDFNFWKTVLISGILISIAVGIASLYLDRFAK